MICCRPSQGLPGSRLVAGPPGAAVLEAPGAEGLGVLGVVVVVVVVVVMVDDGGEGALLPVSGATATATTPSPIVANTSPIVAPASTQVAQFNRAADLAVASPIASVASLSAEVASAVSCVVPFSASVAAAVACMASLSALVAATNRSLAIRSARNRCSSKKCPGGPTARWRYSGRIAIRLRCTWIARQGCMGARGRCHLRRLV